MVLILYSPQGINSTFIGCLNYPLAGGVCHMEHKVSALPDDRCSSLSSPCGVVPVVEVSSNDSDIVICPFCTLLIAFKDVHNIWILLSTYKPDDTGICHHTSECPQRNDPSCCCGKIEATFLDSTRPVNTTILVCG